MFDLIIKNGTIVDGSGEPLYRSDVGVKDDVIKRIGDLHDEKAELIIDASGKIVCPGFIDVNNHSDTYWQLFFNPSLESLVYQGITTIVGGNCGSSLAPLTSGKNIETIQKWADLKKINVNWLKFDEFLKFLETKPLAVNFASLVGHGTIRRGVMGDDMRNLNPKELSYLRRMVADSMRSGALGMSTGLIYTHARIASTEELVDLAKVVKDNSGVYTSHVRGEADDLISSIEEAVQIAQASGVKLHISHLKAMGEKNWPKFDQVLDILNHAKANNVDLSFDVYPYTNTGSVLYSLLPAWVSEGGKRMMLARLKDRAIRAKVIQEMMLSGFDYDKVEIAISPLNKTLARRRIVDIARSQEKTIHDAIIDILIASEGRVIISAEVLSEDNVKKAIIHPLSFIATNGAGYSLAHSQTGELVHPRSFGTCIKILSQYVKQERLLGWEEAIAKMTWRPAQKFALKKRGKLQKGFFADILVLDQNRLESPADKNNPYQYAKGLDFVIINGKITLKDGIYADNRFGRVLRK